MKYLRGALFGALAFMGLSVSSAHAAPIIGGICSGGAGLTATFQWSNGDACLSWSIDYDNVEELWTYDYKWESEEKDISHIIIQVSDSFTVDNIFDGTTEGWELAEFGDEGGSNPGIPDTVYGLKFEPEDDVTLYNFTIVTDRGPVEGDTYVVDGKKPGEEVYAYNTNFGECSGALNDPVSFGCVAVPDSFKLPPDEIPAPATLGLLGFGLLGMGAMRYRRKR